MAYVQTGQPAKARESWARAFRVAPDSAAGHLLTAQMMMRVGLDEMAEAELKQALAKDPRLPHAHLLLGQTALFRGRLDEAVALLKRELEVSPGDAHGLLPPGRRLQPAAQVGRRARRAAEVDLDQPVLQRAVHPAGQGLHEEGRQRGGRGHVAAGRRSTTPTTRPRTTCSASCCSRRGARTRRGGSWRPPSGCRGPESVEPVRALLTGAAPGRPAPLAVGCAFAALVAGVARPADPRPLARHVRGRGRARRPPLPVGLRRRRAQALHHRDQRRRRGLPRLRQRRLARRARPERDAAARRRARGRACGRRARRPPTASTATAATGPSST